MIKMDRVNSFSPTPSSTFQPMYFEPTHSHSQQSLVYAPIDPSLQQFEPSNAMMTPHGQMVMQMSAASSMECGPSPFLPDDGISPYGESIHNASLHSTMISPTNHLDPRHHAPMLLRNHSMPGYDRRPLSQGAIMGGGQGGAGRPMMTRNHSMIIPPRPAPLHRQASLQIATSARSASPHMMAGDIFDPLPGSPVKRPQTVAVEVQHQRYEAQDMFFAGIQGISPARAMGPPPTQPIRFSPRNDAMITPYTQKTAVYEQPVPSPATSSTSSSLSSQQESHPLEISDEENDSPTRGFPATRAMSKLHTNDKAGPSRPRPPNIVIRPQRPGVKPPTTGGRTSAKFAKVAEDPGVEGIPPGPRSMDRPSPSFACIIGQAILKCSAGGLSLEHIYRYVETAYPFFKNDNPAWRNSVRHNLSIHKMFETIPRTEHYPPGKGGIWIIHEDEKCHWPEENKFIKNFPSSHPHHAVCRQTVHDRAKEQAQMEKAVKEGKVYIPKKGKKGRKLPDSEDAHDMVRTSSDADLHFRSHHESSTTPQPTPLMPPPPLPVFEEDGEFLPMDEQFVEEVKQEAPAPIEEQFVREEFNMPPPPPRFERKEKKRLLEDDENVFTTTKRVRVAEPVPLAPILVQQQQEALPFDDTFITPERERPVSNAKMMSSAFKTPALVNTSSSPGSSPMPPTVTRTAHHPSALQQAWTHEDMAEIVDSSPRPMLDTAFDFQPLKPPAKNRAKALSGEDEYPISAANPPKTPLSRSSAGRDLAKTPAAMLAKTPMTSGRSPAQPPPTVTALLSTPLWEMGGCLDRLKDVGSSPTHHGPRSPMRSPMPPTSPTRYAMLLGSGGSPSRRMRDFSL